jgi:hypothetical protein
VEARGDAMSFLPALSFAVVLLTNLLVLVGGIDAARAAPEPAPAEPGVPSTAV